MLLANSLARQPPRFATPADADAAACRDVHAKIFANYRAWCDALEVPPQFAPPSDGPDDAGGPAADLLLWLCVWGEAADLRHMPECLCFLYHSAAAEWAAAPKKERSGDAQASLYLRRAAISPTNRGGAAAGTQILL